MICFSKKAKEILWVLLPYCPALVLIKRNIFKNIYTLLYVYVTTYITSACWSHRGAPRVTCYDFFFRFLFLGPRCMCSAYDCVQRAASLFTGTKTNKHTHTRRKIPHTHTHQQQHNSCAVSSKIRNDARRHFVSVSNELFFDDWMIFVFLCAR